MYISIVFWSQQLDSVIYMYTLYIDPDGFWFYVYRYHDIVATSGVPFVVNDDDESDAVFVVVVVVVVEPIMDDLDVWRHTLGCDVDLSMLLPSLNAWATATDGDTFIALKCTGDCFDRFRSVDSFSYTTWGTIICWTADGLWLLVLVFGLLMSLIGLILLLLLTMETHCCESFWSAAKYPIWM